MPACVVAIWRVGELPARRLDRGDDGAARADRHRRHRFAIIGAVALADRVDDDLIGTDRLRRADAHRRDGLGAEARRGQAEQGEPGADMGERAAPERQRQAARAGEGGRERDAAPPRARDDFGERAEHDENRQPRRDRRQHRPAMHVSDQRDEGDGAADSATLRRWATPKRSPRFQASEKPNGVRKHSASKQQRRRSC